MMDRWNKAGYFPKSALADTNAFKCRDGKAAAYIHNIDTWEGYYRQHPEWDFEWEQLRYRCFQPRLHPGFLRCRQHLEES